MKLDFDYFLEICQEILSCFKIGQK